MKTAIVWIIALYLVSCSPRPTITSSAVGQISSSCTYSDDSGESFETPVRIAGIQSHREAIAAEYRFISKQFGTRGKDWYLMRQTLLAEGNKVVDVVEIQLQSPAQRRCVYFDAGNFLQ